MADSSAMKMIYDVRKKHGELFKNMTDAEQLQFIKEKSNEAWKEILKIKTQEKRTSL